MAAVLKIIMIPTNAVTAKSHGHAEAELEEVPRLAPLAEISDSSWPKGDVSLTMVASVK